MKCGFIFICVNTSLSQLCSLSNESSVSMLASWICPMMADLSCIRKLLRCDLSLALFWTANPSQNFVVVYRVAEADVTRTPASGFLKVNYPGLLLILQCFSEHLRNTNLISYSHSFDENISHSEFSTMSLVCSSAQTFRWSLWALRHFVRLDEAC